MKVSIYTLSCPETGLVRYVGKTIKPLSYRLSGHITPKALESPTNHRTCWVKSILKKGLEPIMELIEEVDEAVWEETERYWIDQFRTWGFKLTNTREGGDKGCGGAWKKGSSSAKKVSETMKGRTMSQKTRDKISKAHTGVKLSKSHRQAVKKVSVDLWGIPILQYDLQGNYVAEYSSYSIAVETTGIEYKLIRDCIRGYSKQKGRQYRCTRAKGYQFKLKSDYPEGVPVKIPPTGPLRLKKTDLLAA